MKIPYVVEFCGILANVFFSICLKMSDFQTPPKRETAKHVTLKLEMSAHVR